MKQTQSAVDTVYLVYRVLGLEARLRDLELIS